MAREPNIFWELGGERRPFIYLFHNRLWHPDPGPIPLSRATLTIYGMALHLELRSSLLGRKKKERNVRDRKEERVQKGVFCSWKMGWSRKWNISVFKIPRYLLCCVGSNLFNGWLSSSVMFLFDLRSWMISRLVFKSLFHQQYGQAPQRAATQSHPTFIRCTTR